MPYCDLLASDGAWISTAEAGRRLAVSIRHVYELIERGEVQSRREGARVAVLADDIERVRRDGH